MVFILPVLIHDKTKKELQYQGHRKKLICWFVVANYYNWPLKLIGINLIGILNHVKKSWILFKFKYLP